MSWEAVSWATKQRMKLPQEQLVLLVLANCADPDGVAFTKWNGREHWWKYLVRVTRLSKSSLFRHLNTIEELGLATRSMLVLADGARRPTIQLDLEASFDIEQIESQSHGETETDEATEEAENTSDFSDSPAGADGPESQSHGETGSHGETEPFPIVGMHKDSKSYSKDSPLPPSGGTADPGWEDFKKAWLRPMERPSVAKSVWDHIPTAKQGEAIAAAKGYFAWVGMQRKEPAVVSAQTFLRENAGWEQWLRFMPAASGAASIASTQYALDSPDGKAIIAVYELAGVGDYLRSTMLRNSAINYLRPVTPQMRALSQAGPKDGWRELTHQQAGAWEALLRETVTVQARRHLREGDRAPWPWPPRKDGTISTETTDQDFDALADEGMRR